MAPRRRGVERDGGVDYEVSPEIIWGSSIRVPAIVGRGSGAGFDVENLCVPHGWGGVIGALQGIDEGRVQRLFREDCEMRGLVPGRVVLDPHTRLVCGASLTDEEGRVGRIALARSLVDRQMGRYEMVGVSSPDAAISLTSIVARLLTPLTTKLQPERPLVSYVGGSPSREGGGYGAYFSRNLIVPQEWLGPGDKLTTEYYRSQFLMEASNIAGRFGLTIAWGSWQFTERGVLRDISILEGNACGYFLDSSSVHPNEYTTHNVDNPLQALALHGIVATHMNYLLDQEDKDRRR